MEQVTADPRPLILRMKDVTYIDSAGVGMMVGKYLSVRRLGGDIKLLHLSPRSYRVMTITKLLTVFEAFDSEEQAVEFANSTKYGLSATLWTRDLQRAHRVAAALDCGTIWINCWLLRDLRVPFGGMKESGVGREGGFDSLNFFTEAKNVCVKL